MKQLWILAGGNGAGKSRFYDTYLKDKDLSFVNADRLAKEISDEQTDEEAKVAQAQAMDACLQKILNGETFCFETVFSHESKLELIKKAKSNSYQVFPLADKVALVDNSSTEDPLKTVARISNCKVVEQIQLLPKWAEEIINSIP
jgi:predicted ABC-type ATPase